MGAKSVVYDSGWVTNIKVFVDSTSAKVIASQVGIGKMGYRSLVHAAPGIGATSRGADLEGAEAT